MDNPHNKVDMEDHHSNMVILMEDHNKVMVNHHNNLLILMEDHNKGIINKEEAIKN
jgi:hypothetical protein